MPLTILTVPQMLSWSDAIALHYDTIGAALDAGAVQALQLQSRVGAVQAANGDADTPFLMYESLSKLVAGAPAKSYFGGQYRQFMQQLKTQINKTGPAVNASIIDADSFASYYNGITPYSCLFSWEFALVYYWAYNVQLSPGNVFAPGGPVNSAYSYTTAGGIVVTQTTGFQLAHGAISAGLSTFATDNGGVVPAANTLSPYVQGYSAVIPELVVGTGFAGTGTVVLTFSGTNQAGVAKTWTVTVVTGGVGLTSGTVVTLTPVTGGDRMRSVTAVATSGTTTAGSWTLRVKQEAGRPA